MGPYAAFGKWMRDARIAARLRSQPQAVLQAKRLNLTLVKQGKISHLERGRNTNPDPELLRQLATLYELTYETVVAAWMKFRYGVDPTGLAAQLPPLRERDPEADQWDMLRAELSPVQRKHVKALIRDLIARSHRSGAPGRTRPRFRRQAEASDRKSHHPR